MNGRDWRLGIGDSEAHSSATASATETVGETEKTFRPFRSKMAVMGAFMRQLGCHKQCGARWLVQPEIRVCSGNGLI